MKDKPLEKYRGEGHQGSDRTAPYPVSRMAPATELVDLAREIAEADRMLGSVAHGKLKQIAAQMQALQAQARQVLEQTQRDQELHRAQCNFQRKPGNIYHLYRRDDGRRYFSLLSPADWHGEPPHPFVGSYRLESDLSWSLVDEGVDIPEDAAERDALLRALLAQQQPSGSRD